MIGDSRSVFYGDKHEEVVRQGVLAMANVLYGDNTSEKESLLLCLDKYMDPHYGFELPDKDEIELLLQQVIISQNTLGVKEDALGLLTSYAWSPFEVLRDNLDKIELVLLPDVLYALNMDKDGDM